MGKKQKKVAVVMYTLQVPIYLAAGTAAQQLDASFCTDSSLEIYR